MAFEVLAVIGLKARGNATRQALAYHRCCRTHIDGTGQRVLAKENALWATQDFHLLEVKETDTRLPASTEIHAVEKKAYRLLKRLVRADGDTAHGDDRIHRILCHREVRHVGTQFTQASDRSVLNQLTADCRHRNRHVLQTFGPLLSRDHDLFECLTKSCHRQTGHRSTQGYFRKCFNHYVDSHG